MPPIIARNISRILFGLVVALCIAGLLVAKSCSDARTAKTVTNLSKNQTGAAIASGKDAVETLGNAQDRENQIHTTVKDGTDAIQNAPAGNSNDAADRATCGLRLYRRSAKCVALLGPAPK